jgi:hypothetical protein
VEVRPVADVPDMVHIAHDCSWLLRASSGKPI